MATATNAEEIAHNWAASGPNTVDVTIVVATDRSMATATNAEEIAPNTAATDPNTEHDPVGPMTTDLAASVAPRRRVPNDPAKPLRPRRLPRPTPKPPARP